MPNIASPFKKIYKETSTRIADMNAVWCKALVFDFCITSSLSRISFSSFNMTTSSCSSCSPETLFLRARVAVNCREDARPHAAQDSSFEGAQLRRALGQIKHSHTGSGTAIDGRLPCARKRQSGIHAGNQWHPRRELASKLDGENFCDLIVQSKTKLRAAKGPQTLQ